MTVTNFLRIGGCGHQAIRETYSATPVVYISGLTPKWRIFMILHTAPRLNGSFRDNGTINEAVGAMFQAQWTIGFLELAAADPQPRRSFPEKRFLYEWVTLITFSRRSVDTRIWKRQTKGMKVSADSDKAADVQTRLRSQITYAREAYEFALLEFEEASQQAHELGLNTPDGVHALYRAAARYKYYLRQYNHTVKRLVAFLRTGSDPDVSAASLD